MQKAGREKELLGTPDEHEKEKYRKLYKEV